MKTKWVAWTFDTVQWSKMVKEAVASLGIAEVAKTMDLDVSTINRWCRGDKDERARPSMVNFMLMCNLCDFDPKQFFTTEE